MFVVILLILRGVVWAPASGGAEPDELPAFVPHPPILIDGAGAWTAANGVTGGNGTDRSPWVVEGWDINASTGVGVAIRNTLEPFVVRRVYVHGGYGGFDAAQNDGISMDRVANGRVEASRIRGNAYGINIFFGTEITIEGNDISGNAWCGVCADLSRSIHVRGNLFLDDGTAVGFGSTISSEISDNRMLDNQASGANLAGEQFRPSASISVMRNDISNSAVGVRMQNVEVVNVLWNRIRGSRYYGVQVWGPAPYLAILWNDFIDNYFDADLKVDDNVTWSLGYPSGGNFWANYTGEDRCSGPSQDVCPDSDGIGDAPFAIHAWNPNGAPAVDPYPKIPPQFPADAPANRAPVALFAMTPAAGAFPLNVTFDASEVWDLQDPASALEVRWDWDGDGGWDTPWSTAKVAHHVYADNGSYSVQLEVRDNTGLNASASKPLRVTASPGAEPTSWPVLVAVSGVAVSIAFAVLLWKRRGRVRP